MLPNYLYVIGFRPSRSFLYSSKISNIHSINPGPAYTKCTKDGRRTPLVKLKPYHCVQSIVAK